MARINSQVVASFMVGLLFAIGLGLSGMTNPHKVMSFLNLFGAWDPSLIFVMAGAIGVHFFAYRISSRRTSPLLSPAWHVPTRTDITTDLIVGSLLFGIGWGLGGFCPGPALAAISGGESQVYIFLISLLAGMYLHKIWQNQQK